MNEQEDQVKKMKLKKKFLFTREWVFTLAFTISTFFVGVWTKKGRNRVHEISYIFGLHRWVSYHVPAELPTVEIEQVYVSNSIQIRFPTYISGDVNLMELLILCAFVKQINPKKIFEIGTGGGRTTTNLAVNSPDKCEVFTLDVNQNAGWRFEKLEPHFRKKIVQLIGNSTNFRFDSWKNEVDLIFIDGDHSYETVIKDSQSALEMMRNGGVIIWHDYTYLPGVTKVLNFLYREKADPRFSKIRHIKETGLAYFRS